MFHRPEPDHSGTKQERFTDEWSPYTPTVVHVRTVAFGLTVFETTKDIQTVSVNGKRVPVDTMPPRRHKSYGAPTVTTVPSGSVSLGAYSPYPDTSWHEVWTEPSEGGLTGMVRTICRELEEAAPHVARLAAEADERTAEAKRQRQEEQRRWEEQQRERARQEEEERRRQSAKESREQLLAIVDAWALANRVESFFQDTSGRLARVAEQDARERLAAPARSCATDARWDRCPGALQVLEDPRGIPGAPGAAPSIFELTTEGRTGRASSTSLPFGPRRQR